MAGGEEGLASCPQARAVARVRQYAVPVRPSWWHACSTNDNDPQAFVAHLCHQRP